LYTLAACRFCLLGKKKCAASGRLSRSLKIVPAYDRGHSPMLRSVRPSVCLSVCLSVCPIPLAQLLNNGEFLLCGYHRTLIGNPTLEVKPTSDWSSVQDVGLQRPKLQRSHRRRHFRSIRRVAARSICPVELPSSRMAYRFTAR